MDSLEFKEKLNKAFGLHQQGNLPEAEVMYKELLQEDSDNANVLNLLGMVFYKKKQYINAAECLQRAVSIAPDAYFYFNLGNIYSDMGEIDRAIDEYKKGLQLEKDNLKIIYSLANIYKKKNEFTTAIAYYEDAIKLSPKSTELYMNIASIYFAMKKPDKAAEVIDIVLKINPQDAEVLLNLGLYYREENMQDKALETYNRLLEMKPDSHKAYLNLGCIYKDLKEYQKAIECFKEALNIRPDYPEVQINLAMTCLDMEKPDEAEEIIETVLKIHPDRAEALLNLGVYYNEQGVYCNEDCMLDKAIEVYSKILQIKPDSYNAYVNLSTVYYDRLDYDKSLEYCYKALDINPDRPDVYLNFGNAYKGMRDIPKTVEYYEKALSINPDYADAHFNLSLAYLIDEVFDKAWPHYEWRFLKKEISYPVLPKFSQPAWDGSPIKGKTIYVCHEQGYGDGIQFSRYLSVLASMGAKVIYKSQPALERLFRQSDLNAEIINADYPDSMLEFDTYTYLMSLPLLLGVNNTNIPYSKGYLKADRDLVNQYKEEYFENDYFKVGICWNGSLIGARKRGIPLEYFYNLARINNLRLYSLQKGPEIEKLQDLPEGIEITDLGKTFDDFADTAAAVENLDLVISVDTSIVHLAGALGKPVWNLITQASCWRWYLNREDSPWYKSMRIIRQKEYEDRKDILERVYSMLSGIQMIEKT